MSSSISKFIGILTLVLFSTNTSMAYNLRKSVSDTALLWGKKSIEVTIDTSKVKHVGGAADAVKAAFATWTSTGMPVKVKTKLSKKPLELKKDGINSILWQTTNWGFGKEVVAMTVSTYSQSTAFISETDIVFNARDYAWTITPSASSNKYDIQNVATHEVGHFFGLGHSKTFGSTMFATTPAGETSKRILAADDRDGIVALITETNLRLPSPTTTVASTTNDAEPQVDDQALASRGAVGCSAAGNQGVGSWLVVALVLGAWLARRRIPAGLSLAAIMLTPLVAEATVVRSVTVEQMSRRSAVVVKGTVTGVHLRAERGLIFTDYTIAVKKKYKGTCGPAVTLTTLGGKMGDEVMDVAGMPRLVQGRTVVLFGKRRGLRLFPVGLAQGVFHLSGARAIQDSRGLDIVGPGGRRAGKVVKMPAAVLEARIVKTLPRPERR